jgi:pyruvate-formate lyase-activating enzyme
MNSPLWHITVLSNLIRGYDKYARVYSKAFIPESTYADRFFLLKEGELAPGIAKASALLERLGLEGNRLIALRTMVLVEELRENTRTGIGRYIERGSIVLDAVAWIEGEAASPRLTPVALEEACALSLRLLQPTLHEFAALRPRSLSILPIAKGCQAACPFCFSDASASAEQDQARLSLSVLRDYAQVARDRGAERFVITGGGEPGLLRHELLCDVIAVGSEMLGKAVMITNGHHLARRDEEHCVCALAEYHDSGLRVLAISRHHHDDRRSAKLMNLETDVQSIARIWEAGRSRWPGLRLRFTCVLQRGAVDSLVEIEDYVSWAAALGVTELCFKELYVSTSVESVYHRHAANDWSHAHQVPLSLVLDFASRHGFTEIARLPWGAPVFRGEWRGHPMQIAAYTEPSLLWERSKGIARSWNLMADGRCLVSLEDRASELNLPLSA